MRPDERYLPVDMPDEGPHAQMVDGAMLHDDGENLVIDFSPPRKEADSSDHFANLAEGFLDESDLDQIGHSLFDAIDDDRQSRQEWENNLLESISLLNLKYEEKSWPFQNASTITSPIFMQVLQQTVSNIMAELFPASGPARIEIVGEAIPEREDRADRVSKFMNFYLTKECREYYPDKEQAFMWCVLNGSMFVKVFEDPIERRPIAHYIKPQDFVVNNSTRSLETCSRMTQLVKLTDKELKQRKMSGMYRDTKTWASDELDNDDRISEKLDSLYGFEKGSSEYNKEYNLYECHVDLDLPGFEDEDEDGEQTGLPLPYIVTIDVESQKVLSIYRNWKEEDPTKKRIQYFVHYYFLPSFGFYGFGLMHVASGAAKGATIASRQIMDAAMLSNFPGGVRVKGMRLDDNNIRVGPTEFTPVETGGLKIQEAIMPLPYKEPSPALMQIKTDLEESIVKLSAAIDTPFADFNPNAPVGTTMALLEQANRVQSGIMRRLHRSLSDELSLIYKLFSETLPDIHYPYAVRDMEHAIMRRDFTDDMNIVPVSDPNIITKQQRLLQAETVQKFAMSNPELHDMRNVYEHMYREMGVVDIDKILPNKEKEAQEAVPLDPVTENQNILAGKPVKAGLTQDHAAHIAVHQSFVEQQAAAMQEQQQQQPSFDPNAMAAHIAEHTSMQYLVDMQQQMGFIMPEDPSQIPIELQNQIAMAAAQAVMQKKQQEAEQQAASQPIDPMQVAMEDVKVKQMGVEARSHEAQVRAEIEMYKAQTKAEIDKLRMESEFQDKQADLDIRMKELEIKMRDLGVRENKAQAELEIKQPNTGIVPIE